MRAWFKALVRFVGDAVEALINDDRERIRRQQHEYYERQRRWLEYLSRPG